jgi:DNA ligase-1
MKLDRLFKKTSTGAIQFWDIEVFKEISKGGPESVYPDFERGVIKTTYGQLNTDSPQTTEDRIDSGKNHGKKNVTTAFEQAISEAKAKYEKQKKKGYVDSLEAAQAGETDDLIEGGILPMLAHTFEKQGHKITYPCYVQPKLDGIRCIAILKDGRCTLWSRTRKKITSCPHLISEIEANFKEDIVLDGELYNSTFKNDFEHIVHLVRQEEPDPQCTDVQYHVYDTVNKDVFEERFKSLYRLFNNPKFKYLKLVTTSHSRSEEDSLCMYTKFKELRYEGAMLRNANSLYVNKRSSDLIKVKEMQDAEFEIIGIEEGNGKLAGHVGAFVCYIDNMGDNPKQFKAKMSGSTEKLKEYFENHSLWKGKLLTVQFQDLTSYGIPRFPVGLRFREEE